MKKSLPFVMGKIKKVSGENMNRAAFPFGLLFLTSCALPSPALHGLENTSTAERAAVTMASPGAYVLNSFASSRPVEIQTKDFKNRELKIKILPASYIPEASLPATTPHLPVDNSNNVAVNRELLEGRALPTQETRPSLRRATNPLLPAVSYSNNDGTHFYAISPTPSTAQIGAYAGHEVKPSLEIGGTSWSDNQRVVYAPTLLTPNNCPLEVVTAYVRYWWYFNTDRVFGVWDHNRPANDPWAVYESINQNFIDKYVRTINGRAMYYTQVLRDANSTTWRVYLYNWVSSSWEQKHAVTGTSNVASGMGWDMHERYLKSSCVTVPGIVADGIRTFNGVSWRDAKASNGTAFSYGTNPYTCGFSLSYPNGPGEFYYWYCAN